MRSFAVALLVVLGVTTSAQIPRPCRAASLVADPAPAVNYPDQFVWKLFVEVNARAKEQVSVRGASGAVTSNDALVHITSKALPNWIWATFEYSSPRDSSPPGFLGGEGAEGG